ncbi:MAG: TatD family hydrolase [Bacteroidales bacterium]|nr:TatD family hydrolase [Bacteroidales bacterium]MDD4657063.1 TatD family hydrolase [Bacteroidales bacterium]
MKKLIDTHVHLYDKKFKSDLNLVVERAKKAGISKVVLPAIDSTYYHSMIDTASNLKGFAYICTGLHPTSVKENWKEELNFVKEQSSSNNYIAIGEIGIDAYWSKEFIKEQVTVFEEQLKIASNNGLPVIIHSRDATSIILDSLKRCKHLNLRGVFHAFSGSYETYKEILKLGDFMVGIGGVITFKNSKLQEVVEKIELNNILLETDAPWLTPAPYRGKRNEPAYLDFIASKIAQVKNVSIDEVASLTTENAKKLFTFV